MSRLSMKIKHRSEDEKEVVLLLDEISLARGLNYNKYHDQIEGYEDFGYLGRTDKLGNMALVFYIRGLLQNWKMSICTS